MRPGHAIAGLAALAVAGGAFWYGTSPAPLPAGGSGGAAPTVPELTVEETAGRALFDANCAVCHGANAAGSDRGPPLVHRIYEPSHHADLSFVLAVRKGVRAHHWRFGDMPAVAGVTEAEAIRITAYVRALQRANGIF
jgi:mono/diheme cytochrome c family protein